MYLKVENNRCCNFFNFCGYVKTKFVWYVPIKNGEIPLWKFKLN